MSPISLSPTIFQVLECISDYFQEDKLCNDHFIVTRFFMRIFEKVKHRFPFCSSNENLAVKTSWNRNNHVSKPSGFISEEFFAGIVLFDRQSFNDHVLKSLFQCIGKKFTNLAEIIWVNGERDKLIIFFICFWTEVNNPIKWVRFLGPTKSNLKIFEKS